MTYHNQPPFWRDPPGPRLPRIALMGEFSAGKSTLANLMIETNPLPVQVVATQLPPVWISHGAPAAFIVDLEGNETPCDLAALKGIVPQDVAFIRVFASDDILTKCDIIDMPGISDPNMASTVWERIIPLADGIVWCSPATQAWRQSEAAVWGGIEGAVRGNSLLVLTRGDMLLTEKDKTKVLKRVCAEAGPEFLDVLMMSLSLARDAGDDEEIWKRSGADAFVAKFLALVENLSDKLSTDRDTQAVQPLNDTARQDQDSDLCQIQREAAVLPRRPELRRRQETIKADDTAEPQPDPKSFMPKFS